MALLTYRLDDGVARITIDDGKVNALSPAMLEELHDAFGRAATAEAPVVLRGREGIFSAGFDLKVLTGTGGTAAADLLKAGFTLSERMLSHPAPVVVACTGHAIAMGVFLVLSGDYRIGVRGPYRLTANEVAIGMTLPRSALEICQYRVLPGFFDRTVVLAEVFPPDTAVAAGILDAVADPDGFDAAVEEAVTRVKGLNQRAHYATKLRARQRLLASLREAITGDDDDFRATIGGRG
jgi:enoyl-CoA hydratase/carnithine racemase